MSDTQKLAAYAGLLAIGLAVAAVFDPKRRGTYTTLAGTSLGVANLFLRIGPKERTAQ
jgi:hypothetical protein